jgi:uncharacterized protein YdhG (YjbR/CyaY superfamily)
MKKSKPSIRKPPAKAPPKDFEEYLAQAPKSSRRALVKLRSTIRSVVPAGSTETISYRIPAFRNKAVLVWYAAFAKHCSVFPTASVIRRFKEEIAGHNPSTGTVHFPHDKPLPAELIKRMVKARIVDILPGKKR